MDDSSLNYCCEVPTTVSGNFVIDSNGNWYGYLTDFSREYDVLRTLILGILGKGSSWRKVFIVSIRQLSNIRIMYGRKFLLV
jgi:hypothetical protein